MRIATHRIPAGLVLLLAGGLLLAACDSNGNDTNKNARGGIYTLGLDFVRVFNQNRNDEPIMNVEDLNLNLTPRIEPFVP